MSKKNRISSCMQLCAYILSGTFALLLYLQMCIASLTDGYQLGIEKIQLFQPSKIIIFLIILAIFTKNKYKKAAEEIFRQFYWLSFILMTIIFIIYIVNDLSSIPSYWIPQDQRTLSQTLKASITHPDFSGRSFAIFIHNSILLIILAVIIRLRTNKSNK